MYTHVSSSSFARFLALKFPRQTCPTLIPICSVAGKRWFVVSGTFRDGPACVRIVYPLKQGQMHPWIRLSVSFVPSYRPPNTQSPLIFSLRHITEAKMRRLGPLCIITKIFEMKSGYNGISFNSIFERVNNKPFIVEISSCNGMKLVLIVPILSLCRKIVSRGSIYSISRVSTIIQRIWIVSFRFVSYFSTNLVFVFLYLIFDIYRDFKIFLFCFILCSFNRVLAFVSIYIVDKFVRFITFLFVSFQGWTCTSSTSSCISIRR